MNSRKTLVVLSPGFPANEEDCTCLPAQQSFLKSLKEISPELQIIVISFQYPYTSRAYRWYGIDVIPLDGRNKGKFHRLGVWAEAWKQLRQIRRTEQIQGIFSFWCTETALIGKWFGKHYRIKHVCWISGQDAKKTNIFVKYIRPRAEELAVMSDFLETEFMNNHRVQPAFIVPPGIEPSLFESLPDKRDIDLLGCGSLIPLKRYDLFIQIVHALKAEFPEIRAVICGKGPEKEKLQALITDRGLNENIFLTGEQPHREVLNLMQRSKVFLHPSEYEGFGVVCIEALYAGAKVVSLVRPMKNDVENWHTVLSEGEMMSRIKNLLTEQGALPKRVTFRTMTETAKNLQQLFS
jgi:glycosyltransferase involved in cell wall biosynthesis